MLITNDILRDHTLLLRDPLLGRKWYDRHVVNVLEVGMKADPRFYQRRIQGIPCPVTNDGVNDWSGTVWHFPVKDWGTYDRFVIRIPTMIRRK